VTSLRTGPPTRARARDTVQSPALRRIVQVVADLAGKPLAELRILDLACFEGQYAIEFALHGAQVVGIEGREANIAKARDRATQLELDRVEFVQEDVRNLRRGRYGGFDAVLCLGILYHLDFPDAIRFLERVSGVCDRLAVLDTHINLGLSRDFRDGRHVYRGRHYIEHSVRAEASEREQSRWASLDNARSVWLTRASLMNALIDVGFTSAYECDVPPEPAKPFDRRTFAAVKASRAALRSTPGSDLDEWERVPEHRSRARLLRNHGPGTNQLKQLLLDVERLWPRRGSAGYGPRSWGHRR